MDSNSLGHTARYLDIWSMFVVVRRFWCAVSWGDEIPDFWGDGVSGPNDVPKPSVLMDWLCNALEEAECFNLRKISSGMFRCRLVSLRSFPRNRTRRIWEIVVLSFAATRTTPSLPVVRGTTRLMGELVDGTWSRCSCPDSSHGYACWQDTSVERTDIIQHSKSLSS